MKRTRRVLVAVVLVIVPFLALVFFLRAGKAPVASDTSSTRILSRSVFGSSNASRRQSPMEAANLGIRWGKPGEVYVYRVNYTLRMEPANQGNFEVSTPISNATIRGYYHVRVLQVGADDVILGTQFSGIEIRSMDRAGILEQFLNTTPVVIRFSRQGQILGYHLPAKTIAMDRNFLIGMNCVQVVLAPGKNWTKRETDGAGEYSVLYSNLGKGKIGKQKLKYVLLSNASPEQTITIIASSITASLGSFWLDSYRGEESTKLTIAGAEVLTAENEVDLVRCTESVQPPSALNSLVAEAFSADSFTNTWSTEAGLPNGENSAWDEQEAANTKTKYENVPFQQVYGDLLDANRRSPFHAEHLPAIVALKDWLLVHPDHAQVLSAILKTGELSEEIAAQLIHALELSSASEMSQKVLADLLNPLSGFPSSVQVQAAVAAGGIQNISASLSAALLKMAFEPPVPSQEGDYAGQNAALLALGALARNNQTIADTLVEKLTPNLDTTVHTETDLTVVALLTLKNGAIYNKDLLETAESLLVSHEDEHIRKAALDYVAGSTNDNRRFVEWALNDQAEAVRIRSLELLATSLNPSESVISSAINMLRNAEESEQVRMTAIDLLMPLRAKDTRVSSLFQQIQTDQPESAIALRIKQANE